MRDGEGNRMTADKDPRIESVAKLLFTGPLWGYNAEQWESDEGHLASPRHTCLMAAEDVLRGIEAASPREYGVRMSGEVHQYWKREDALKWAEEYPPWEAFQRVAPGPWEPLP
jgi:hypothetical protein